MTKPIHHRFRGMLILALLMFSVASTQSRKEKAIAAPVEPKKPLYEQTFVMGLFPKLPVAIDSILPMISAASVEVSPSMANLLFYKTNVKVIQQVELSQSEQQFLAAYCENKVSMALSRDRRFGILNGHDLRVLKINATDSTFKIRNTQMENDIQTYANDHRVDGILTVDILISETKLYCFLTITDLNFLKIWTKEFSANYVNVEPDIDAELERMMSLKKITGYTVGHITIALLSADAFNGTKSHQDGALNFVSLGYRYNVYSTIINRMNFFIDTKTYFGLRLSNFTYSFQPGLSFEILKNEEIGPRLLTVDLSYGYHIIPREFLPVYTLGFSLNMSRSIGLTGYYSRFKNQSSKAEFHVAGNAYGIQMNFVL
jgi:hypothetical protein